MFLISGWAVFPKGRCSPIFPYSTWLRHVPRISPRREPPALEGAPRLPGSPRRSGAPMRPGPPATRGPGNQGPSDDCRGPLGHHSSGAPRVTRGTYMNETLIYIFLPSKRFIHCLVKNIPGPEGPPEGAQGGTMAPVPPLGTTYVTDRNTFEYEYVAVFMDMSY